MNIVVASNNKHKLVEIRDMLGDRFENIYSLSDLNLDIEVDEDKDTFLGNALKKAQEVAKITNMVAISDDSGLEVEVLNGAPGVYSARYAGEPCNDENNNDLLLKNLDGIQNRKANFTSVVVLAYPNGDYIFGEGKVYGKILEKRDGTGGFGYDPLFFADELGKTFGTATSQEKNSISHRSKALKNLVEKL